MFFYGKKYLKTTYYFLLLGWESPNESSGGIANLKVDYINGDLGITFQIQPRDIVKLYSYLRL
jgi:hypothetical protein